MSIFAQRINRYTVLIMGMRIKIVDIGKVCVKDLIITDINSRMK